MIGHSFSGGGENVVFELVKTVEDVKSPPVLVLIVCYLMLTNLYPYNLFVLDWVAGKRGCEMVFH